VAVLARQCERYRDMHLAWQAQRQEAKACMDKLNEQVLGKDGEAAGLRRQLNDEISGYKARLGAVYRGLQKEMDDLRAEKAEIENRLQESMQREKEQTAMIESLENRNKALRSTLDKTVQKLSDVQSQRLDAERDRAALESVKGRMEQGPELAQALQQITLLSASRDRAEEEATAAKTAVLRLQNDVARERALAACFEQFVRRIALGPESAHRTGGGFRVDSRAKAEAAALLKESEFAMRQTVLQVDDGVERLAEAGDRAGLEAMHETMANLSGPGSPTVA